MEDDLINLVDEYITCLDPPFPAYGHRKWKTAHPVRSAVLKTLIGGLVVGWVTTSEYPLLYVFALFLPKYPTQLQRMT